VTELGFTASVFPERAAVQEAPNEGESFFDTLSRAEESAENAGKVTDDKPDTAQGNSQDAETNTKETQVEKETPEINGESEKKEQTEETTDVVAQMLALGRMIEVVQPEQNVEITAQPVSEAEVQVQAVSTQAQNGEGDMQPQLQLLTPVENGEEVVVAPAESKGVEIGTEGFAEAMTQTLSESLEALPDSPEMPVGEIALQPPRDDAEVVQTGGVGTQLEEIYAQTESVENLQMQAPEETVRADTAQPVETEDIGGEAPADLIETQFVDNAESAENTSFSQSFAGEGENFSGDEENSLSDNRTQAVEAETDDGTAIESGAMQQTLRARFSLDNAVQQIDNTELAQAIEKAIDRFAEDFRLAEVDTQQITIRLDPEELGSVSITVAAENNALTAKIVTDNKEAASLLSAQIEQFLEAMEQKGIKVEKAEVTYNSQLDLGGQAPNEHSGGTRENNRTIQNISAVEMVEAEQAGMPDENAVPIAAVQDEATNYYVFDDKYVPNHVYKV